MSFVVRVFEGAKTRHTASLCLAHRLFVVGWALRDVLAKISKIENPTAILAVGFLNEVPVAVAVQVFDCSSGFVHLRPSFGGQTMVFCRMSERRNGYATACINAIQQVSTRRVRAKQGNFGSASFWRQLDVEVVQ